MDTRRMDTHSHREPSDALKAAVSAAQEPALFRAHRVPPDHEPEPDEPPGEPPHPAPGEPASPVPDHPTQHPGQDENAAAFIDMPMQTPLESVAGEEDPGAGLDAAG